MSGVAEARGWIAARSSPRALWMWDRLTMQEITDRDQQIIVRLLPRLATARAYRRGWLRPDLIAGLTVFTILVPQGMAYGELAGVEPIAGLYTAFAAMVAYAVFGTSRQLMVGPESGIAILVAASVRSEERRVGKECRSRWSPYH